MKHTTLQAKYIVILFCTTKFIVLKNSCKFTLYLLIKSKYLLIKSKYLSEKNKKGMIKFEQDQQTAGAPGHNQPSMGMILQTWFKKHSTAHSRIFAWIKGKYPFRKQSVLKIILKSLHYRAYTVFSFTWSRFCTFLS